MNIQPLISKIIRLSIQRQIIVFITVILFFEFFIMLVMHYFPPLPAIVEALVDCVILTILITPIIYFLAVRPTNEYQRQKKQAEEALKQSEERYRNIVETSYEGIVIGSPQGEILFANKRFSEMLGYQLKEIIGRTDTDFMYDDQINKVEEIRKKLDEGKALMNEFRFRRKDETLLLTQCNTSPIFDQNGKYTGNLAMHIDITKRKRAEEELKLQEEQRKTIIQTAMDGFWIVDLKGRLNEVNETYCMMSGYTAAELMTINITDLEDREDVRDTGIHIQKITEQGEDRFETRHRRKDGSVFDVEISAQYRPIGEGQLVVFLHDITKRKRAEESLRQSEARYKSLFESNNSVMLLIDPATGEIKDANQAASRFYGWSMEELCRKNISEINMLSPELVKLEMEMAKGEKRNHFFFRHRIANGEIRDVELFSGPIKFGDSTLLYSIVHDITERIQVENALKESELKFRKYIDFAPHGVFVANEFGEYIDVNAAACNMTNYSKEELLSMKFIDFVPEKSIALAVSHFNRVVREGFASEEIPYLKKDGSQGFWVVDAVKISDKRLLGFTMDTTERKLSEIKLIEKDRLVRESQSAAHIGSYSTNLVTKKWQASEEIYRIFGIDETYPHTLDGWIDRVHPDFREELVNDLLNTEIGKNSFDHEYKIIRINDGQERWVHGIGKFEFEEQYTAIKLIGTIQDITERKLREEKLNKLNKTLTALSKSSQAMIYSEDETKLMNQVCQIIVEDCGFAMVWIGLAENDTSKSVRPVASAGFEDGYLETLNISWDDNIQGRGPTGSAIRTGSIRMCRDMVNDPDFEPWREEALKRGYASSIVFPLMSENKTFGAVAIYSKDSVPFDPEEMQLLSEIAGDLSHGITSIRLKREKQWAEEVLSKANDALEDLVKDRNMALQESNDHLIMEIEIRKTHELLIKKAEVKYRTVADFTYNWETWMNTDGLFIYVSPSCQRISGYTVDEFMNDPALFVNIVHPEDRDLVVQLFDNEKKIESKIWSMDFRIINRNGDERWIGHYCQPVFDSNGQFLGQRGSNRDITELKNAEKVLVDSQRHLRQLTQRLDAIAEEERTRIAREIHDELGHLLTALKYDMDSLTNNSDLTAELAKTEMESMISMIDALIDSVRKIATDLRPGILDHLGLFPALEWKIKEFQKRTKICTHFKLDEPGITFDENETTIIYRINQEIFTNVARHSKASKLWLTIGKKDDWFILSVKDDGIGFELKDNLQKGSLGLMGMRERALSIGGEIQIESSPGKGTTVNFLFRRN